jgi:peptidoglycan/LPS O-acetylase OafA/YrhL
MSSDASTPSQKLEWVQAVRGIAALLVVVAHARYYLYGTPWDAFAKRYMFPAAQGVDLFFMVSGFIMVYTTARSDGSLRYTIDFLTRRFARIWPVYAVVVLFNAMIQVAWDTPVSSLGDVARSLAFLPVKTVSPPYLGLPVPIGWTLNFEFYFYLVLGLSLLAGRFRWMAFVSWMIATLVVLPWVLTGSVSMLADHDYATGVRYLDQICNPIVWDFVAGVAIGLLYVSSVRVGNRAVLLTLVGCAFALVCGCSFGGVTVFFGMAQWGLPLSFLFVAFALAFKPPPPRVPRALVWLGGVSYSLYLWHLYVFGAIDHLAEYLGWSDQTHTMLFVILVIPIPVIYAAISRRYLEDGLAVFVRKRLLALLNPLTAQDRRNRPAPVRRTA